MKISCDVVQDLLPLYHDGVCSKDSSEIVDTHLQNCEICKKMLTDMDSDVMPEAAKEATPLLSIQIKWNKEKRKAFLKGLAIAICLFLIFSVGKFVLTEWKCVPMDKDDLVLMEIFETSYGMIHFGYNDLYGLNYYSSAVILGDDGYGYVECYRPILAKREDSYPQHASAGIGFSPENNCYDENGNLVTVERIYLGIANDPERSILVWEKGMEVRPATEEEEEIYSFLDNQN